MNVVNRMLYSLRARAVKTDDMPPLLQRLFVITQLRDEDDNLLWWKIIIPLMLLISTTISAVVLHAYKDEPMGHEPEASVKTLAVLKKQETSVSLPADTKNQLHHEAIAEQEVVTDDPIDQDRNEILDHAMRGELDHHLPDESILEQQAITPNELHSPMMQSSVHEQMLAEGTTGHGATAPPNELLSHIPAFPNSLLDQTHHDYAYAKIHGLEPPLDVVEAAASTDISQPTKPVASVKAKSEKMIAEKAQTARKHVKQVVSDKKPKPLIRKKQQPTKKQQSSRTVVTTASRKVMKKALPLTAEEQSIAAYTDAVEALAKGKLAGAEQFLYTALKHDNNNRQARETLAGLLINHRRLSEAQQVLQQGIKAAPDYFPFSRWLARIYLENNEPANALQVLEQGLDHFQDNADYLALLAIIYQQSSLHSDAIAFFQKAIELRPTESRWWLAIGLSYEAENNWKGAKKAYVEAINTRQLQSGASKYVYDRLASVATKE